MTISERVGFIGIGNMGWPMAANLARAGAALTVHDADAALASRFAREFDAAAADDAADLAKGADVIVTMLPTGAIVREALMAAQPAAGTVVVDMSSSEPTGTRELGALLAAQGVTLIDAPVSGGVPKAVDGTLAIMIGSDDAAAVDRAMPALGAIGDRHFRAGGLGAGHAVKALNNYIAAASFAAISEALVIGGGFGLDPAVIVDIVNNSTGRCFNSEIPVKEHVLTGKFATGFKLGLMAKDVKIAADLADAVGAGAPLSADMRARWEAARQAMGDDADFTAAHKHWAGAAG